NWPSRVVFGRNPRRTLFRVLALVLLSLVFFKFLFLPIRVVGVSMSPTYRDGSINFVNRLAYVFHEPKRGDVVGIKVTGESILFLKRVIGLPGETISIENGAIKVNGHVLSEPYVKYVNRILPWEEMPVTLGKDEYFVVGDNRGMNQEDHTFGRATRDRV